MSIRFRRVDILALRTVELDGFLVRDIGEADGEERLGVAVDSGTAAEICFAVFVHLGSASGRDRGPVCAERQEREESEEDKRIDRSTQTGQSAERRKQIIV